MGGGGYIRNSDVTNLNFLSHITFFFIRFKASPNIHANESKAGGSSSLRVSHRGSCGGAPSTKNIFLFLFLLPIACLNFEQTIAGISISIHFRTVVANFNNLQTHPVCNLSSTNEINISENIFNNNVMQNGISKIVKSWRFSQFLLKSGRLQPHYIDAGDIIYVDILPYNLAQKNCCYRPERSIHQSSDLMGSRVL